MIQISIDIWKGLEYQVKSAENPRPHLTSYILDGEAPRGAVLILPGGCYRYTSPREAEPVALQYCAAGYHSFVLDYSVGPHRFPQALQDICRSLTIIRRRAKEWNIDSEKIVVCGFSAGGHAVASYGVFWKQSELFEREGIDIDLIKVKGIMLAYPVINSGEYTHKESMENLLGPNPAREKRLKMSLEKQVSADTPPVFLWHTCEDKSVPVENSLLFVSALQKHKIPFEMHIYPYGEHGLSLATSETSNEMNKANLHVSSWMDLSVQWLKLIFNGCE